MAQVLTSVRSSQSALNGPPVEVFDPGPYSQLGRGHQLGMQATEAAGDCQHTAGGRASIEVMAPDAPGRRLGPGKLQHSPKFANNYASRMACVASGVLRSAIQWTCRETGVDYALRLEHERQQPMGCRGSRDLRPPRPVARPPIAPARWAHVRVWKHPRPAQKWEDNRKRRIP